MRFVSASLSNLNNKLPYSEVIKSASYFSKTYKFDVNNSVIHIPQPLRDMPIQCWQNYYCGKCSLI